MRWSSGNFRDHQTARSEVQIPARADIWMEISASSTSRNLATGTKNGTCVGYKSGHEEMVGGGRRQHRREKNTTEIDCHERVQNLRKIQIIGHHLAIGWFPNLTRAYDNNGRCPRQKFVFGILQLLRFNAIDLFIGYVEIVLRCLTRALDFPAFRAKNDIIIMSLHF